MTSLNNQNQGVQQSSPSIFNGKNYDFWHVKMKTIFISYDLWEYVKDGYDVPEETPTLTNDQKQQLKNHRTKDAKALALIQEGVADIIFPSIINASKAKEAWDILEKEYRGSMNVRMAVPVEESNISSDEEWLNSIINVAEDANAKGSLDAISTPSSGSAADQNGEKLPAPRIHKVPEVLQERKEFEKYYVPRVVSIGPCHYHNEKLHQMNKLKPIFARELVSNDRKTFEGLYNKLSAIIKQVRDCYDDEMVNSTNGTFTDKEFTRMMLLDGCFILYFIQHYSFGFKEEIDHLKAYQISFIELDFLLLENQLPFIVLKELMMMITDTRYWVNHVISFIEHINVMVARRTHCFFIREFIFGSYFRDVIINEPPAHLLELLHKRMVGTGSRSGDERLQSSYYAEAANSYTVRNVMELKAAGIEVKLSKTSCLTDIHYRSLSLSGRLRLPPITVDDTTRPKLMNLIAYEMYCPRASGDKWVTSYVCFLDSFIDHADDVRKLRSAKILRNRLGSDEQVAKLFNEIGKDLVPHPSAYRQVKQGIQDHYDNKVLNYMAQLKHQHLKNPWTIIALIAGILLLFLTGVLNLFPSLVSSHSM
ncbi:UPF0481 protein At3g47200-like [Cornus florida]|uniref:UPF0481 protein At3g47200-like n=1 Tax=Cornus florida TaxID=4283 RepID=UPI0028A1F07A|nr:UPF0481 protein At3g47200-like [Cornus florida]XP_059668341.1 UPF0481 protein At3g47200-like [Cornus florida]XP_059668342.1 UPF0481 protein At3g47200-like [Cornus florida]